MKTMYEIDVDTNVVMMDLLFESQLTSDLVEVDDARSLSRKEVLHKIRETIKEYTELELEMVEYYHTALVEVDGMTDEEFENVKQGFLSDDYKEFWRKNW